MSCHQCGNEIPSERKIGRQETCVTCGSPLHCCLNCQLYDEKVYQKCREPEVVFVKDKASANFCTYFVPVNRDASGQAARAAEARKKLDQLFKK